MGVILMGALLAGCKKTADASSTTAGKDTTSTTVVAFDKTQPIHPYTRDTTSGTRDGFMTKIGLSAAKTDDSKLSTKVQSTSGNGDMIAKLSQDEYGIGYFSFSSLADAKKKGAKDVQYEGVEATEDSILDGTYKLSRNFNYCQRVDFSAEESVKATIVNAFVAYMGTSEGMTTIKGAGGIVSLTAATPSWNEVKKNYAGIEDDHSSISLSFGGSTSVEEVSKALSQDFSKRAGNFKEVHDHHGSGDAYTYTQKDGTSHKYDIAFASREFNLTSGEPLATGSYGRICIDGIAVGVNSKNPLATITGEKLLNIYKLGASYTTWQDLD